MVNNISIEKRFSDFNVYANQIYINWQTNIKCLAVNLVLEDLEVDH